MQTAPFLHGAAAQGESEREIKIEITTAYQVRKNRDKKRGHKPAYFM